MPAPAHILSLSSVDILLQTRHAILARQFRVTSVAGVDQLRQLTSATPIEVAVFCHGLNPVDCRSAAAVLRRRWPRAKLLALTAHNHPCPVAHADGLVAALDGPEALLNAVQSLLAPLAIGRLEIPSQRAACSAPQSLPAHR